MNEASDAGKKLAWTVANEGGKGDLMRRENGGRLNPRKCVCARYVEPIERNTSICV